MAKKILVLFVFAMQVCFADFPLLSENFEKGISKAFEQTVDFDISNSYIEKVDTGNGKSNALVLDLSNSGDTSRFLRVPRGKIILPINKQTYKISFNYKIISYKDPDQAKHLFHGAITREGNGTRKSDHYARFNAVEGKTGKFEVYSAPTSIAGNNWFFYFASVHPVGAKIAIDNFKIEKGHKFPDWMFEANSLWGMATYPFHGDFYSQNPQLRKISKKDFFPFIDKFGQFKHKEWPNKIHSIEELKISAQKEKEYNQKVSVVPNRDKYMGLIDSRYKFNATGRFSTQKVDGKWFLVTPEGNLFWSLGVCTVGLYSATPITKREHYFEDISDKRFISRSNNTRHLFKEPHEVFSLEFRNMEWKYGGNWRASYGERVGERCRVWGVNTLGCWTREFVLKTAKIPYTAYIDTMVTKRIKSKRKLVAHWQDVPDYFASDFKENTYNIVKKNKEILDSPYCIGVMIDNELPWQPKVLDLAYGIMQSPADQPAKIKFVELLKSKYGEISKLNKEWNAKYKDWADFLNTDAFVPSTAKSKEDLLKIEELYYRQYFEICSGAVKAVSPDTMYFGCRFAWSNPLLRKVATEYADVVSYNWYNDDAFGLSNPEGSCDKPIIISEYHFGNQDRGAFGGGLCPRKTMKARIASNNHYVKTALDNPNIVGVQWFRYSDQITSGRDGDGENFSCGMVDICDTPIYDFTESIRKISERMYAYRLNTKSKK